eukprot:TRINITY_DN5033_c0_g2_i1.p2 TRINITY_DN5033_c0_g2~~TRINITY_DN5033_c0_g2_i1.p2  ORF type:complete len:121 (-),score=10.72 TRINITY_DN5033_c0_g2_i1:183-509(-)
MKVKVVVGVCLMLCFTALAQMPPEPECPTLGEAAQLLRSGIKFLCENFPSVTPLCDNEPDLDCDTPCAMEDIGCPTIPQKVICDCGCKYNNPCVAYASGATNCVLDFE